MNGLDLFSGIGGIALGLQDYVRPIAYCEIDPYCQAVLLSRMADNSLPTAPIWDDITTLQPSQLGPHIDIVFGGFPCQGISCAGLGKGLEDERSGLFFEIVRLAKEIKPRFIFLENVPAICSRGGVRVVREIASLGYECRWCIISAAAVGAMHKRERWFLLAHTNSSGLKESLQSVSRKKENNTSVRQSDDRDANSIASKQTDTKTESNKEEWHSWRGYPRQCWPFESRELWKETVSSMGKCSDGVSFHVDRLRALGNSCVPAQAKEAFEILMGLK